MENFEFHTPGSLDEAVAALQGADEGKLLAGGMSLLPVMKLDLAAPTDVVDLAGVPGLREITADESSVTIGALCTHAEVAGSDPVQAAIPALSYLVGEIGDPQVRNRGTLGGSVAHNDPAADYPAACIALGAMVITNRREIHADDFFQAMFTTALSEDEIVTAVRFPIPERAAYAKFPNPASKYAVVGVMVAQGPGGVRVAVTGAGDGVFRVPEMEGALSASFDAGSLEGISVSADGLVSDTAATAEYRAHLIGVMARRAVAAAT